MMLSSFSGFFFFFFVPAIQGKAIQFQLSLRLNTRKLEFVVPEKQNKIRKKYFRNFIELYRLNFCIFTVSVIMIIRVE